MPNLIVDNYVIDTPLADILERVRIEIKFTKLKDIIVKEDELIITCPNSEHDGGNENHPDCHVNLNEDKVGYGVFHCFACGFKGPFYRLIAECFGWPDDKAKRWLTAHYGRQISPKLVLGDPINIHKKAKKVFIDTSDFDTYQSWCPYLAKRGISRAICNRFNVKYDPQNKQVVFPCYDETGKLIMFARRSIETKMFFMDENVDKPVYGLDKIINQGIIKVLICEGPFDCLTANEYGFPAIATLGTPSPKQLEKIFKAGIRSLYLMFDNDAAGRRFTEFIKNNIDKRIMTTTVLVPNGKKDINDLTRDEFELAIKNAEKNRFITPNSK